MTHGTEICRLDSFEIVECLSWCLDLEAANHSLWTSSTLPNTYDGRIINFVRNFVFNLHEN
jgi:hypothetical protein